MTRDWSPAPTAEEPDSDVFPSRAATSRPVEDSKFIEIHAKPKSASRNRLNVNLDDNRAAPAPLRPERYPVRAFAAVIGGVAADYHLALCTPDAACNSAMIGSQKPSGTG